MSLLNEEHVHVFVVYKQYSQTVVDWMLSITTVESARKDVARGWGKAGHVWDIIAQ